MNHEIDPNKNNMENCFFQPQTLPFSKKERIHYTFFDDYT